MSTFKLKHFESCNFNQKVIAQFAVQYFRRYTDQSDLYLKIQNDAWKFRGG